ncbi:Cytochrome c2 [Defluviimonas aquaemixtae]|uniref:Cytochrome c2 n=1 Tax=Albidovulum aquaemixtae TaxID=1542388 RepID=A0A2R8BNG4_9RHOB|nr:cytochrome c family protein [Defluviimonas aquaemixtae]SPH24912.1 Cytochrome c2 [Defluviimonas aquaemixtae]
MTLETAMRRLAGVLLIAAGTVAAQAQEAGDAANGEKVFRKCKACHDVGEDAKAKVGPPLNGVIGRPAAAYEDFAYSDAMKTAAADGLVWSPETIAELLEKPKDFVPGTKMTFAGLRKEEERADVIAYLATFADE